MSATGTKRTCERRQSMSELSRAKRTYYTPCFMSTRSRSRRSAMRADAGDFNDRGLRDKPGRARRIFYGIRHRRGRGLTHCAACLANQKHDRVAALVIVHAGDEGIAAFDAMDQALLAQEIECAVDSNWRRPRRAASQPVDQLISAKRLMACQQGFQHSPAHRRQTLIARSADRFGVRNGVARATFVVMIRLRKDRVSV